MPVLGVSAFYHDSAAVLLVDGEIVAAAQEERFSREKHDSSLPRRAIEYCLAEAGLDLHELDCIAFYDKPLLKFDRLLETYASFAPRGVRSFVKAMPVWLKRKLNVPRIFRKELGYAGKLVFAQHHESHAASAFFPSPFEEAAILTIDGVGEWATTTLGRGTGNDVRLLSDIRFPHSLGLLYSAFTYYTGFRVNSGEYKVMGLAPYGEPRYADRIYDHLIDLREDGSFRLDLDYFDYCAGLRMTSRKFHHLFDGPPREPESEITQRDKDLARSIQVVIEEAMLRQARHLHERTGLDALCLAGGVALNCVGNGRILREGPYRRVWVQPAAGDAGGALGAALVAWHRYRGRPRTAGAGDAQRWSLLGPAFADDDIATFLARMGVPARRLDDEQQLAEHVAQRLARGEVVGWFQGRMEYGPRALGSRSILGDPRDPAMQRTMNLKIKKRESFRPFAPVVLADKAAEWFAIDGESPYMLFTAQARTGKALPAVTHVDGSARVQTLRDETQPRLARVMRAFAAETGCPVLINTSFNVRGEPIVCTPDDAYRCFLDTEMDALVLGCHVLDKAEQPDGARPNREFALD